MAKKLRFENLPEELLFAPDPTYATFPQIDTILVDEFYDSVPTIIIQLKPG